MIDQGRDWRNKGGRMGDKAVDFKFNDYNDYNDYTFLPPFRRRVASRSHFALPALCVA
jgi:hypothetical protein